MQRRQFLSLGAVAVGSGLVAAEPRRSSSMPADGLVDTNVWLSQWPRFEP